MSKLMEEAISTNPVIVEEMKMIEEPRKSPNTSDGCCYQQRRTPLKDICNEPRAKKVRILTLKGVNEFLLAVITFHENKVLRFIQ